MILPDDVRAWLESNRHDGYVKALVSNVSRTKVSLAKYRISEGSELGEFYLFYGPFSARGWYTLNEVEEIAGPTQLAWDYGAPTKYIALTSFEGDGVTLYDRESGAVYDVERGKFEALVQGELAPLARSFGDFLRWCKERVAADARR